MDLFGRSLAEARTALMADLDITKRPVPCPCCDAPVKLYHRPLGREIAEALVWLCQQWWATPDAEWILAKKHPYHRLHIGKVRYWGLVEQKPNTEDPSMKTVGLWRPTELGLRFVSDPTVRVPKYKDIFHDVVRGESDATVNIVEALRGDRFHYLKLMEGSSD